MCHSMQENTGALVCALLEMVYVDKNVWFQNEAARRGITLEQLTAAAITEAMHEHGAQRGCRCAHNTSCGRNNVRNSP